MELRLAEEKVDQLCQLYESSRMAWTCHSHAVNHPMTPPASDGGAAAAAAAGTTSSAGNSSTTQTKDQFTVHLPALNFAADEETTTDQHQQELIKFDDQHANDDRRENEDPITTTSSTTNSSTTHISLDHHIKTTATADTTVMMLEKVDDKEEKLFDSTPSASTILLNLETIHQEIFLTWQSKIERFQMRLKEYDPITNQSRYGPQTKLRVEKVLQLFHQLQSVISIIFYGNTTTTTTSINNSESTGNNEEYDNNENSTSSTSSADSTIIEQIRKVVDQEKMEQEQMERMKEEQERQQQEAIQWKQQQEYQEQQRQVELKRQEQQRIQNEIMQQAEQLRLQQLRIQQEKELREQEWVSNITKGIDGVQEQLNKLLQVTEHDGIVRKKAIVALHTLYSQIIAQPEEIKFRRIRRDHPQFMMDIGHLSGGCEILIASGFRLGTIDEIPSFICTEPNIETNMDEWSIWFQLLKSTLQIIEKQLILL